MFAEDFVNIRSKKAVESNAPDLRTHKILKGTELIVPRESYIKAQLSKFSSSINHEKKIKVMPYPGAVLQDDDWPTDTSTLKAASKRKIFLEVEDLPIFDSGDFDPLNNGHQHYHGVIDDQKKTSHVRLLTLNVEDLGIVGAIEFSIDSNLCTIFTLGVNPTHKRKGFGTILLQAAILVASLHGCTVCNLSPSNEAVPFYESNGFIPQYPKQAEIQCSELDNETDSELDSELDEMQDLEPESKSKPIILYPEDMRLSLLDKPSLEKLNKNLTKISPHMNMLEVLSKSLQDVMEAMRTINQWNLNSKNQNPNLRVIERHFSQYQNFKKRIKVTKEFDKKLEKNYFNKRKTSIRIN